MARQTSSTWTHDDERNYFVFTRAETTSAFKIDIADEWKSEARGSYVWFGPPNQPVGMDVYLMGRYSSDEESQRDELFARIRLAHARLHARGFEQNMPEDKFQKVTVGDVEALFFEGRIPRSDRQIIWRQWSFVMTDGNAYTIVSAIEQKNDATLWPQVQAMVKSFKHNATR